MSKRGSTDAPGHKEHLDDEDSDMEGLLVADQKNQMKPFNVDTSDRDRGLRRPTKPSYSILELVFAYCSYTCVYAPRVCLFLGVVALVVPTYFVIIDVFLNPTEHFGVIANDYTDITSRYDLSIGKVDHWCLRGDNDSCRCEDPLQPQARGEFRSWSKAHKSNVALVQGAVESATSIGIAFLGESVVEEMDGRWFGDKTNTLLSELAKIFDKNFSKEKGGKLDGLAIGVAGDTNPSVLWRLMNGEMPDSFDPKIWWLQLGLNDLGRMRCSEEIVVLGILRIVEEILAKKPNAKIVINSLLPMPDLRGGVKPGKNDFQDSFQTNGKKKKNNWMIRRMEALTTIEAATAEFDTFNLHDENRVLGHRKKKGREEKDGEKNKKDGERNKKGKRNPTMDAHKTEQKKFNPVTHKERKMPLWTSITAINEELKKFCTKHERVTFFDATDIFAENDGKFWVLKTDMITARGHPTPSGYSAWEVAIVERAKKLLDGSGIV